MAQTTKRLRELSPTRKSRARRLPAHALPSSRKEIEEVAAALIPIEQWLKEFGTPHYGIKTRQQILPRPKTKRPAKTNIPPANLPPGWSIRQLGHRFYIFRSPYDKASLKGLANPKPGTKIPDHVITSIRKKVSKGIKKGEQRPMAAALNISESQLSRIIRNLRRKDTRSSTDKLQNIFPPPNSPTPINSNKVDRALSHLLTVRQWIDRVGIKVYGIESTSYVYQMCARRANGPAKKHTAELPANWRSVRAGNSWLIHHTKLTPGSHPS